MNFSTVGNLSFEQYLTGWYGTIENLISEAKSGNMEAQTLLGTAYCDGAGNFVSKNSEKAIGWLTTSVENGCVSPNITAKLGELLDRKGTPQHRRKAYEMYRRSAELGCPESQINLAEMYRCGVEGVVNEDIKEAFEWYKRAADEAPYVTDIGELDRIRAGTLKKLGNVSGSAKLMALKLLYQNYLAGDCPEGCPQPGKSVSYLNRAAELGDAEAQSLLGQIYCEGSCEQIKNVEKGKRWLRKAAANGEFKAKQLLEELSGQSDNTEHTAPKVNPEAAFQSMDVMYEKLKQRAEAKVHPFAISQPVLFTEEMLSQFGDSPTARIYLEAYKLVKEGLEILRQSKFTDGRGITLIARGFLTENSIFQAFPWVYLLLTHIYKVCEEKLRKNPRCFEALVLSFAFQNERKLSVQSAKTDIMKLMCVKNLIQFIREAEPDSLPSEDPFELDKNYSSWLHVLYYHMGSLYTIGHLYEEAAEALENAVNCCPSFYEYKRALGYALLNLYLAKKAPKRISVHFGEHSFSFGQDNVPNELLRDNPILMARKKSKYAPWTVEKLRNTTVRVLKEFLDEAPTCYKTYPNACYYLACIAVTEGNLEEFKQYYERGQDAEEKRLPFLDPVNLPLKDAITPFYELFGTVQSHAGCDNWACKKKVEKKDLKSCVCRKQKYCSKDCQKADWSRHKPFCTWSKEDKKKDSA